MDCVVEDSELHLVLGGNSIVRCTALKPNTYYEFTVGGNLRERGV